MTSAATDREPAPSRRRHLSGSILSVGASRGASVAVIAVTSIIVARMLGPAGIGTYAIAHALLFVFTVIFELGLPQALAYYAGREEWSGSRLARGVVGTSFGLALPGSAAMLACFALFGDSTPGITWPMAIALAIALPFSLLWRIGPQAALAQERFEAFAVLDSSPALLLCPTSIAGAAIAGTEGAIIGLAVATVGSGLAVVFWLSRTSRHSSLDISPPGGLRAVFAFGLPAWASELLIQLNLRIDLILVGSYLGAADGGVYSVALSATSIAWLVMAAFAISALPRSARLQADSERDLITTSARRASDARTTRHAVLAMPVVGIGVVLLLTIGIPLLYGDSFDRSVELGLILLPGSLLLGLGMAAIAILLAGGETRRVLRACLAIVPATVVAYALAIPAGGATAAAIVASLSYAAFTVLAVAELRAASGLAVGELLIPGRSDLADYRNLAARGIDRARSRRV
jgi:O-antigen/teichoic acid export membrane protein